MASKKNGQQSTTTGGSADGSAPVNGLNEFRTGSRGKPRQHPVVQAGFSDSRSGPSIDAYREFERIGRAASQAVNAGAPDDSGPAPGYDDFVASRGRRASRNTWADPSSQG